MDSILISRNGEQFGPYTYEELTKYVNGGNVLATDLAWKEGMSDWVCVEQLLLQLGVAAFASEEPFNPPKQPGLNRSVEGSTSTACGNIPDGVKGWRWGAVFSSWIWATGDRVLLWLLALLPLVGFFNLNDSGESNSLFSKKAIADVVATASGSYLIFLFYVIYKACKKQVSWKFPLIVFFGFLFVLPLRDYIYHDWAGNVIKSEPIKGSSSKSARAEIEQEVARWQTDPQGAQFGELAIDEDRVGCIGVNLKNKFGGYVGEQQAIVLKKNGSWVWVNNVPFNQSTCLAFARGMK